MYIPILYRNMSKYTKELLEPLVAQSTSLIGVVRKLGITSYGGGTQAHIKKIIASHGIDTSHFLGIRSNCGPNHKGGNTKKTWQERLVISKKDDYRAKAYVLRRALIESGRKHKCESCGCIPFWNNKELVLQVEHKNGKFWDNRSENLEFLCPNCHSQTSTFCGRKNGS